MVLSRYLRFDHPKYKCIPYTTEWKWFDVNAIRMDKQLLLLNLNIFIDYSDASRAYIKYNPYST